MSTLKQIFESVKTGSYSEFSENVKNELSERFKEKLKAKGYFAKMARALGEGDTFTASGYSTPETYDVVIAFNNDETLYNLAMDAKSPKELKELAKEFKTTIDTLSGEKVNFNKVDWDEAYDAINDNGD